MNKSQTNQDEKKYSLPDIYKAFYDLCSISAPKNLIGTDLRNRNSELNEWAIQLLEDGKVESFLEDNDFVLMMHQGYIFWYFKANGDPDPIVYGYQEGKLKTDSLGHLSIFLKEYFI